MSAAMEEEPFERRTGRRADLREWKTFGERSLWWEESESRMGKG